MELQTRKLVAQVQAVKVTHAFLHDGLLLILLG